MFKRSKYGNKRTELDGYTFDSLAEAKRYQQLKFLLGAKAITDLKIHPRYEIIVNSLKVGYYEADFEYKDKNCIWVEDVKGFKTDLYKFKIKCFIAMYPHLNFREVKVK
jgi:hypothetical protein